MKKIVLLLCFLLLVGVANAALDVNIFPDPVMQGTAIHVAITGDSYYRHVYIYDSADNYQGRITLDCARSRCSGNHYFNFSISFDSEPGRAYIRIYDYSNSPNTSRRVGWTKFYFNVNKSDFGKAILTCSRTYKRGQHRSPCDEKRCGGNQLIDCEETTRRGRTYYAEVCESSYKTECMENPKCKRRYNIIGVEECGVSCTDSDGGKDYYVKGTATGIFGGQQSSFTDSCCSGNSCDLDNGESVLETYCEGEYIRTEVFDCPNGCQDGACVNATTPSSCDELPLIINASYGATCTDQKYDKRADTDSDGDIDVFDLASWGLNSNNLTWCSEQLAKTSDPCAENVTCTDSDGGEDYYMRGTVSYWLNDAQGIMTGTHTSTDQCADSNTLWEYSCNSYDPNQIISPIHYTCPNGCEDGACVEEPKVTYEGIFKMLDQECDWYTSGTAMTENGTFVKDVCHVTKQCLFAIGINYNPRDYSQDTVNGVLTVQRISVLDCDEYFEKAPRADYAQLEVMCCST